MGSPAKSCDGEAGAALVELFCTCEVMFYLSSLPGDAVLIGRAIRAHWGIENQLHWVLHVTWGEDNSRIRTGHREREFCVATADGLKYLKPGNLKKTQSQAEE